MPTMKLFCQAGKHHWERPAQRGRPPLNCPEHTPAKPEPQKRSQAANNSPERMAELRDVKAQRDRERAELAREADEQRRREIAASIPALDKQYQAAFANANKENTPEAWHKADVLQARIINSRKAITA